MATTLYFITETYLKGTTAISNNVDTQDVMPYVRPAAELNTSLLLGREYFDYLVTAYNAASVTSAEITLVEHIQPAVAWRAASIALSFAWSQFKNKGPQKQNGDYSIDLDLQSLGYMRNEYENMAEYYENRLTRFLQLNKDDYPGWTASSNDDDTPPDSTSNWDDNGMFII
jgi:hypothetical protein